MELFDILTVDLERVDIDFTVGLPITTVITDPTTPWQNLVDIDTDRPAGKYEVTISMVWNYNTNRRSGQFRWTVNGHETDPADIIWLETSEEPKDKSDKRPFSVTFPIEHSGGIRNIKLEATRESNAYEMTMYYATVTYKRIG
jgi:hypothetical protein